MAKVKSDRDLVNSGIKALVDALGYSGAARFLRHFSKGRGDYLLIQEKILKGWSDGRRGKIRITLISTFREFSKRGSSARDEDGQHFVPPVRARATNTEHRVYG